MTVFIPQSSFNMSPAELASAQGRDDNRLETNFPGTLHSVWFFSYEKLYHVNLFTGQISYGLNRLVFKEFHTADTVSSDNFMVHRLRAERYCHLQSVFLLTYTLS